MSTLVIGLAYETLETCPRRPGEPPDAHVEYEPESTIEALEAAVEHLGHRSLRLGSPHELWTRLRDPGGLVVDAVLNVAEGHGSRNREAWVPVLLEMAGIPVLGSDALSLSLSLDKAWANRWARAGGIVVAPQATFAHGEEARQAELPAPFPLFVKPRWEGTAKGIRRSSRVESREALAREVDRIQRDYRQPALVEAFLSGPEYTVTLIGNDPPEVLPVLQRAIDRSSGIGVHALEGDGLLGPTADAEPVTPGVLDAATEGDLAERARRAFELFECHDFARVDFRLDESGVPVFLEINPLPTFAVDGSFGILAEIEGVPLAEMLGRCLRAGLDRLGL